MIPEVYASYSTDDTLMASDMAEQAAKGYSPMVSRQFRHSLVASLFGHRYPRQTIAAPANIPLDPEQVWRGAAIYIEPRESGFYDALRAFYPDADFREIRPPSGGRVLYYSAYVSREQLEAAQGLVERRTVSGGDVIEGREEEARKAYGRWKWARVMSPSMLSGQALCISRIPASMCLHSIAVMPQRLSWTRLSYCRRTGQK